MAVIKANAYGHGIVPTARALIAADAFGVARLNEALALRNNGLGQSIVLLEGVFARDELDAAAAHSLEIVVHSFEQIALLKEWRGAKQLKCWLKVDTGMNRLGFRLEDFPAAWRELRGCVSVASNPKIMTHLASADDPSAQQTQTQLNNFAVATKDLQAERSIANSAGLLSAPNAQVEWVRPGLMLYGISPFNGDDGRAHGLHAAMTLMSRLIAIRDVRAGEHVGYGGTWTAGQDCRIGIAAIGYGDGYPRQITGAARVRIRDRELPIAGRVSMDMIAIDLATLTDARVGDEVVLWGKDLPVERLAQCAGTIPYELVCGISQRVDVQYR